MATKDEYVHDRKQLKSKITTRAVFKLWICDVHLMIASPIQENAYLFRGQLVERINIFGTITGIKEISDSIILYEVDDGTANINCVYNHHYDNEKFIGNCQPQPCHLNESATHKTDLPARSSHDDIAVANSLKWLSTQVGRFTSKMKQTFNVGDVICVKGRVNQYFGQREIKVFQLHLVDNIREETSHILEFCDIYQNHYPPQS